MEFAWIDEEKYWVFSSREISGEILVILNSKRVLYKLINKLFGDGNYSIYFYFCII